MDRTYLYIAPEENAAVRSAGGHWDERLERWYLTPSDDAAKFAGWLGTRDREGAEFSIVSERAYVALATVCCCRCQQPIEVVCLYCDAGTASGVPLAQFTVTELRAVDDSLARQLMPWPGFRQIAPHSSGAGRFANHCPQCGTQQDDRGLYTEPGEPFFEFSRTAPGAVRLTPLVGQVRLSGDARFILK